MINGMRAISSASRKMAVSSTEVSGRPSIVTAMAPIPMATPAIMGRPARCDRAMPPAAPMNIDGNVGPPRKALSESE